MSKVDDKPKGAPRKGPDFGLKLLDGVTELPEEKKRTRASTPTEIIANLAALQEHPNVWAEVAHYAAKPGSDEHPTGAKKTVFKFINGDVKPPPAGDDGGSYDIEWRSADWDGSNREGTVMLAMYVVTE